jgi:hypothetical protein
MLAIASERVMVDLARETVAKNLSVRDVEPPSETGDHGNASTQYQARGRHQLGTRR